jgi:hypothetical protein
MPQFRIWVFLNRVLCTRIHGYTVLLAPIKALPCLCFFPPMAEKTKPPALRVVGDLEHYDEKRYKIKIAKVRSRIMQGYGSTDKWI